LQGGFDITGGVLTLQGVGIAEGHGCRGVLMVAGGRR
jgi:hypothetical protein